MQAPPEKVLDWDEDAVQGPWRWLQRVYNMSADHITHIHNDGGGNGTNHGHGSSAGVSQHPLLVDLLSNEGKLSAEWLDQLSADDKVHSTLCVMSLF